MMINKANFDKPVTDRARFRSGSFAYLLYFFPERDILNSPGSAPTIAIFTGNRERHPGFPDPRDFSLKGIFRSTKKTRLKAQ
jgi:hypothetical protein